MFDYRMWLAPYLAIIFLVCCCLITTCFAQMYENKDTKKGGEIELKASERKKIRKKNRKSSPYGSTDKTNSSHSLCTSETQTSLPYYAENATEKTADGIDHQCDEEDDTVNENDNQLKEGDRSTNTEEITQDDNDNEICINLKKGELEKENIENSIDSENAKNESKLEIENRKNSEMTEAINSKITGNSSGDEGVCVD